MEKVSGAYNRPKVAEAKRRQVVRETQAKGSELLRKVNSETAVVSQNQHGASSRLVSRRFRPKTG